MRKVRLIQVDDTTQTHQFKNRKKPTTKDVAIKVMTHENKGKVYVRKGKR
jgi:hypothetical protein